MYKSLKELPAVSVYTKFHTKEIKHQFGVSLKTDFESLPFDNREQYLEWRKIWRDAYKALSIEIRAQKDLRKNPEANKSSAQSDAHSGKVQARIMLEQRKASKLKAAVYRPISNSPLDIQ